MDSRTLLAEKGLKVTRARLAVLNAFRQIDHPLSTQEVAKTVGRSVADQATVYRVIQSFLDNGILREVNLRHTHVDFELADAPDHHHIVCTACGLVENFIGCEAEVLAKKVLKRSSSFKLVREHAIELFGLCRRCAA